MNIDKEIIDVFYNGKLKNLIRERKFNLDLNNSPTQQEVYKASEKLRNFINSCNSTMYVKVKDKGNNDLWTILCGVQRNEVQCSGKSETSDYYGREVFGDKSEISLCREFVYLWQLGPFSLKDLVEAEFYLESEPVLIGEKEE